MFGPSRMLQRHDRNTNSTNHHEFCATSPLYHSFPQWWSTCTLLIRHFLVFVCEDADRCETNVSYLPAKLTECAKNFSDVLHEGRGKMVLLWPLWWNTNTQVKDSHSNSFIDSQTIFFSKTHSRSMAGHMPEAALRSTARGVENNAALNEICLWFYCTVNVKFTLYSSISCLELCKKRVQGCWLWETFWTEKVVSVSFWQISLCYNLGRLPFRPVQSNFLYCLSNFLKMILLYFQISAIKALTMMLLPLILMIGSATHVVVSFSIFQLIVLVFLEL